MDRISSKRRKTKSKSYIERKAYFLGLESQGGYESWLGFTVEKKQNLKLKNE